MSDSVDELVNRLVGSGMVVSFQSYKLGSVNRRMKKLDSQFQLNLNEYATDMRTALNDDTSSFDIELNFNAQRAFEKAIDAEAVMGLLSNNMIAVSSVVRISTRFYRVLDVSGVDRRHDGCVKVYVLHTSQDAHFAIPPTTLYSLMVAVANAKVGQVTPRIAHPDSTQ